MSLSKKLTEAAAIGSLIVLGACNEQAKIPANNSETALPQITGVEQAVPRKDSYEDGHMNTTPQSISKVTISKEIAGTVNDLKCIRINNYNGTWGSCDWESANKPATPAP